MIFIFYNQIFSTIILDDYCHSLIFFPLNISRLFAYLWVAEESLNYSEKIKIFNFSLFPAFSIEQSRLYLLNMRLTWAEVHSRHEEAALRNL